MLTDFGAIHRLSDILGGVDSAMPNGNNAGIRDEPDPGNLSDPPFNNNVFADGAGFPGGAPGSGKTLTQAVLNGTNAIPVNGNYPPIPATSGAQWAAALDKAVFHILTSMNRARLLEGTPYGSQSGGCTAAAANCTPVWPARPDLATLMAPDFAIAKDVAEKSATLLKNSDGALPLKAVGLHGRRRRRDGPDRHRDVRRRRRQRARDAVRADHELADRAARGGGRRHRRLRPGLRPRRRARAVVGGNRPGRHVRAAGRSPGR